MYEALVKMLRSHNRDNLEYWLDEAADAIEELIASVECYETTTDMALIEEDGRTVIRLMPEWIPVTERLPEEDGMYLVHGKWSASGRKVTDTCEFYVHDGYFRAAWNFDVTHWMPLPEPPKEDTR